MATAARGSKRTRDDVMGSNNDGILVLDDEDDKGTPSPPGHGSKRLSRNMSEKMRRVRMNNHMMELASIVPSIVNAHKKLDKTSILRLTVNFLRLHSGVLEHAVTGGGGRPDMRVFNQLSKILAEQLNGFLLLIDGSGTILYSSDSIQHYIGINVEDVLGQPVSCIVHPDDKDLVWQQLLSAHPPASGKNTEYRSAELRLLTHAKGQESGYTKVKITGPLKSIGIGGGTTPILIGVVQPMGVEHVTTEISSNFDISTTQYISKHSLNGEFIDVDVRACLLVGYLQNEMQKISAYDLIHADDLPFAANAHLTMLRSNGSEIPTSLLRLKAKNGIWVYSYTSSHLVIDMWTKKPRHLISVNNIVSKSIGERALEQQRKLLEDLNLDKIRNCVDPQAVGQTVLEVATELTSSECSSPSPSGWSPGSSSPGAPVTVSDKSPWGSPALLDSPDEWGLVGETNGTVCTSDSSHSLSGINSSIVNHSCVSSSGSSPVYPYSSAMISSSVNLNGNDTSSVLLDNDNGETTVSCSGKGMMTPSPVNSSCSMSPSSDNLNSPGMDILPGYSRCRHSSLENRSLSSSFQTLYRSDASHAHAMNIQPLFIDSHKVDPMDIEKWMHSSSMEENSQAHSSIEEVVADTSTEHGGPQLDGSGAGGQCPEQPSLFYLLTCDSESTDASREAGH